MNKRAAKSRADYTRMILSYQKIRKNLRIQYPDWKTNTKYLQRIELINKRLKVWRNAIDRIDKTTNKLNFYNRRIRDVYDYGMYKSVVNNLGHKINDDIYLLRKMFCKYLIEQGINGKIIASYIGWKDLSTAARYRNKLNKMIGSNEIICIKWNRFKKSMDRFKYENNIKKEINKN